MINLLKLFFPPRCPVCDVSTPKTGSLCEKCEKNLHRLDADANFPNLKKVWFDKCKSVFAYEGGIKDALHLFKYNERLDLVPFFSNELLKKITAFKNIDIIVPVPIFKTKLRHRGFNQSILVAKRLGKMTSIKVDVDSLVRVKELRPQVGLQKDERIENVKNAFVVNEKRISQIEEKYILLIDDVITTGATVNECAKALVKSGAAKVDCLSIARTL